MTQRDRIIVTVVVALAAVVGAWLLFIAPERSQANHLGAEIKSAQQSLTAQEAAVANGLTARHEYTLYFSEVSHLGQAVPSDDDVPTLMYQLQSAAKKAGVDFHSISLGSAAGTTTPTSTSTSSAAEDLPPGVVEGPAGLPEEPFSFTFNGSFFQLGDFLARLQKFVTATDSSVAANGRLMTLNSIQFAAGPNGFPSITATISATTYLVPAILTGAATSSASSTGSTVSTNSTATSSVTPTAAVTPSIKP